MKRFVQNVTLVTVCLVACLFSANAQERSPRVTEALALSAQLYLYGQRQSDALAVINAAAIRKTVKFKHGSIIKDNSDPDVGKTLLSWEEMLVTAADLAGENQDLKAHIEDVRAHSSRGLVTGAIISKGEIEPLQKREFSDLLFEGGAFAEVYSEGKEPSKGREPSNIDMFVYDQSGTLVCSQTAPDSISLCGWTPRMSSKYKIVLENKSNQPAHFWLFTN